MNIGGLTALPPAVWLACPLENPSAGGSGIEMLPLLLAAAAFQSEFFAEADFVIFCAQGKLRFVKSEKTKDKAEVDCLSFCAQGKLRLGKAENE